MFILFLKAFFIMLLFMLMEFWNKIFSEKFMLMELKYFNMMSNFMKTPNFELNMDPVSNQFCLMVSLVTLMVLSYSSYYMEFYNNKKFMIIMMLFFFSMVGTVTSMSWINLITSWDILGLSSIFLVLFYPNKTSTYNSNLTMMFNRMGDVMMIMVLSYMISSMNQNFFLEYKNMYIMSMLIACSFTKSAQFPLSTWLPAAMSAPTPISAMVHSSTLVTAGLFLMMKLLTNLKYLNLTSVLTYSSMTSFIAGGILALKEPDLKKMIAYSTMSQISMIMLFLSLIKLPMASAHMFYHAFFKTLLFCSSGFIFMSISGDQNFKSSSNKSKKNLESSMMFLSLTMMTGMMFTSAFYSKDYALETLIMEKKNFIPVLIILASMITIAYSTKIMYKVSQLQNKNSNIMNKKKMILVLLTFCIITVISQNIMKLSSASPEKPLLMPEEIKMIILIIFIPSLINTMKIFQKMGPLLSKEVFFMKKIYSKMNKIPMMKNLIEVGLSDKMMMAKSLKIKNKKVKNNSLASFIITILMIFIMM